MDQPTDTLNLGLRVISQYIDKNISSGHVPGNDFTIDQGEKGISLTPFR